MAYGWKKGQKVGRRLTCAWLRSFYSLTRVDVRSLRGWEKLKVLPFSFLFRQKARGWHRSYFKRFSIHHIRHLPKNKFKKTKQNNPQITFWYFQFRRWQYIYTPMHVIKEGKISPKRRKIDSCLFVSKFTIYLVNSFLFVVLSSRHPYYDFDFIYL